MATDVGALRLLLGTLRGLIALVAIGLIIVLLRLGPL